MRGVDVQWHPRGFWVINITPEAGTVKGGSARVVPLHEHLVERGFVTFGQSKGNGPLFFDPDGRRKVDDDPTNPVRQPWVKSRDKLSEWVRGLGVTDPGISPNMRGGIRTSAGQPAVGSRGGSGSPCVGTPRRTRGTVMRPLAWRCSS